MKKYLNEILLIQLVATYLVILGHSYPFVMPVPGWADEVRLFIYSFHMPLFVWVSGYLLVYTRQSEKNNTVAFVKKRAWKLLLPYVVLSAVALLPKYLAQPWLNDAVSLDGMALVRTLLVPRENVWGHFWFIPMIFLLGVGGYAVDRLLRRGHLERAGWWLLTLLLLCISLVWRRGVTGWLSLSDIVRFGWYFTLGMACAYAEVLERLRRNGELWHAIAGIVIAIVLFMLKWPGWVYPLKGAVIAVVMIYGMVQGCVSLSGRIEVSRTSLYAQTFAIFLLSWPCQAVVNVVVERVLHQPCYIVMPLQFVGGVAGPLLLIWVIERMERRMKRKWISEIIGK